MIILDNFIMIKDPALLVLLINNPIQLIQTKILLFSDHSHKLLQVLPRSPNKLVFMMRTNKYLPSSHTDREPRYY